MKRTVGFLGGVLLTFLLLFTLAVLNGRGERRSEAPETRGWAVEINKFRFEEPQKQKIPRPEPLPKIPKKIPEVSLRLNPRAKPPQLKLEPPPMAFLGDLKLPLSSDLPDELFRTEGASPPQGVFSSRTYEAQEVDVPPYPVRRPLPPYPFEAKRRGIEGKVRVRVLVDKGGRVAEVRIVEARPKGVFEKAVVETLKKWKFRPALMKGKPVDVWVVIPIRFELREA